MSDVFEVVKELLRGKELLNFKTFCSISAMAGRDVVGVGKFVETFVELAAAAAELAGAG